MNTLTFVSELPPLTADEDGTIRVAGSRVLLDMVIHAYKNGVAPEALIYQFTTLKLVNVYGVIAYYLRHTEAVEAYLTQRQIEADALRAMIEASPLVKPQLRRSDLLARVADQQTEHTEPT